jgi:hypothetical protein
MEEQEVYVPITASPVKGEAIVLDQESYNSLYTMLTSSSEEDHKIAQLALNTCDIRKSIYWIYKLSRSPWLTSRMVNLRFKASREFRDKSDLFRISMKNALSFADWCTNIGWMTPEIFQYLEKDIIYMAKKQFAHKFYDVEFKIKEEYKDLPSNNNVITTKNEN